MKNAHTYGGQAVIEGVMIRGQKNIAVAVRSPSGEIIVRTKPVNKIFSGSSRKIPILRGCLTLIETVIIGMDSLGFSANVSAEEGEEVGNVSMAIMITFSILLSVALFFMLPLFLSRPFEGMMEGMMGTHLISNLVEGILRLFIFIAYILLIGLTKDIRRVFMYHGAEHMTVHAVEHGDMLNPETIRKYSKAHPRCGTAFLLTVMVVSIITFTLVPREPHLLQDLHLSWQITWLISSRIILIPLIAGISYEFIRISGKYSDNVLIKAISLPNLALQALTTKRPDNMQIEVATTAMNAALDADGSSVEAQIISN